MKNRDLEIEWWMVAHDVISIIQFAVVVITPILVLYALNQC